ncbi:DMT family transporter [Neobacillus sp. PS3-34]|uniref:DMT family transporter n=1 Tax=Neobacillus sp. PS3-34 TaxID=3070678 RepID=UPI0027E03D3D|nr:DMT family transporter [Neobacillus sp. PS3-34]WML48003.1 DMT family transporter [Neobacillus sp. PS3-34]
MIQGVLLSLIAGSLVSLQNIFNSKVNERSGLWATTSLVLGMGFLASLTMGLIFEGKHLFILQNMKTWYWFTGLIGTGVVICLVKGIRLLGPTFSISIVLTSQLGFALVWDSLGLFGLEKVPFTLRHLIGVLVIAGGIIVIKSGDDRKNPGSSDIYTKTQMGRSR